MNITLWHLLREIWFIKQNQSKKKKKKVINHKLYGYADRYIIYVCVLTYYSHKQKIVLIYNRYLLQYKHCAVFLL